MSPNMRKQTLDKRNALLETILELFVEQGVHNTSISQIAEVSGICVGSIYHYFKDKNDMVNALYIEIKTRLARHLTPSFSDTADFRRSFSMLANSAIRYFMDHPSELLFLEQYENSPLITGPTRERESRIAEPMEKMFCGAMKQRLLKGLSSDILSALFTGSLISLVKGHLAGGYTLDDVSIEAATMALWDLVAR
jgi:TetR/AcrR family transcriptional regulator, repressor of fatR-cypB operon